MAKKPGFVRTTISVPAELKRRMDKITEDVNWSALACRAFESKLAEIISKKEEKDMDDVIARLKESKQRSSDANTKAGREAGEYWVKELAEADEIERMESAWNAVDDRERHALFETKGAYTASESFFFHICPDCAGDRQAADEFWESVLGPDDMHLRNDVRFMEGFYRGALDLWESIKAKI